MDEKKTTEKTVPTIELGGRIWFLKVNHRVLERFSAMARIPLQEFDTVIMRYDMMVLLLWCMMCETRPDLTREGLRGWLNDLPIMQAMNLVSDAVAKAIAYSFPEPAEALTEAADDVEPANPTDVDI